MIKLLWNRLYTHVVDDDLSVRVRPSIILYRRRSYGYKTVAVGPNAHRYCVDKYKHDLWIDLWLVEIHVDWFTKGSEK